MSSKKLDECLEKFKQNVEIESNVHYRQRIKDKMHLDESVLDQAAIVNDFDTEEQPAKMSLLEELCLVALGEERAQMSLLNDNISYVLRACILLELVLARRIKLNIHQEGNLDEPWKLNVVVTDFTPIGDVFLDESLRILAKYEFSLQKWLDVLTGETWDRKLSSCQIQNLRDRVFKSLMEKGIVTSRKTTLFLVETTEYPLLNHNLKRNLCFSIIDSANSNATNFDLRSLSRLLSINTAKVLTKALKVTDAPTSSRVKAFANNALLHYGNFHNLETRFGHLIGDGELHLFAGIFSLYAKINKFF